MQMRLKIEEEIVWIENELNLLNVILDKHDGFLLHRSENKAV